MNTRSVAKFWTQTTRKLRWATFGGCLVLTLGLTNCGSSSSPPTTVDSSTSSTEAPISSSSSGSSSPTVPQSTLDKVKFKQGDTELFAIKYKDDGAKLVDASGAELARFKLDESGKVKIKDAADTVLGYIVSQPGKWKVENADQTQELYIFRRQDDGDYKLEDGADTQIYRIKVREYGYEIETPDKQSLYKVKQKENKISLRDANDQTVLSTKDAVVPVAIAPFGFDVLTQEQQAALSFAVNATGGQ